MPTGYKVAGGADLDTVFLSGSGGAATGYKVAGGADLSSVFAPYTSGAYAAVTGYKLAGGADLNSRFQSIGAPLFSFTAVNESVFDTGIYDPPFTDFYGSAGIRYNTTGTTTLVALINGNVPGTNWGTGGDFTSKFVRLRSYTGDDPSGPVGWQQLNSIQQWVLTAPNGQTAKSCTLTIDFSNDGVNINHTVTVYLSVASGI